MRHRSERRPRRGTMVLGAGLVLVAMAAVAAMRSAPTTVVGDHGMAAGTGARGADAPSSPTLDGKVNVAASQQFGVADQTDVFWVAPNGAVALRYSRHRGQWSAPLVISPPGLAPSGAAITASAQFGAPGRTDVFVAGSDGALQVLSVQGGGAWSRPRALTAPGLVPPGAGLSVSAPSGTTGQTDLFFVDDHGGLGLISTHGAAGPWTPPTAISPAGLAPAGAPLTSSAHYGVTGRTDVFVIGTGGALEMVAKTGSAPWRAPATIAPSGTAPAGAYLVSSGQAGVSRQTEVFVVGAGGAVEQVWAEGAAAWNGPQAISPAGLAPAGAPLTACAQIGVAAQTDVSVVGRGGAINVLWAIGAGRWNGPQAISPIGASPAAAPLASSPQYSAAAVTDVFVADTGGTVETLWVQGGQHWKEPLDFLTPGQLAGQRVIEAYVGTTPPAALLQQITAGQLGGVIFFGDNVSSTAQIAGVSRQLQAAEDAGPAPGPLLLMTDQEGGEVRRLPGGPVPSEKQIGESSDPVAAATAAGTSAGQDLAASGVNVNLAPVLDVYRQAGDFIDQYQRSYSMNPQTAATLGRAFITAQQAVGVAATAKHFPGLGAASTQQNTDQVPVTLNLALATLRSVDEVPYPPAISAGVRLVMVSWAVYPILDPDLPAGLSPTVVGTELRGRLGFTGVTITDSLGAGALTAYGSVPQRALRAAAAGMDLMLTSQDPTGNGAATAAALTTALQDGSLGRPAFLAAVQRILDLQAGLGAP